MIANPLLLTLITFSRTLSTSMFHPSVAFHIEPKHLICIFMRIANRMTGFYEKYHTD